MASRLMEVVLRVVELVGLVAVEAVADDGMLDAFALQILLFVDPHQLCHQLLDEGLRKNTEPRAVLTHRSAEILQSGTSFKFCFATR